MFKVVIMRTVHPREVTLISSPTVHRAATPSTVLHPLVAFRKSTYEKCYIEP